MIEAKRSKMGGSVRDVKSKGEVDEVVASGSPVILHFWASWCEASKHMDQLFSHLSTDFPNAGFLRVPFLFSNPFFFRFPFFFNFFFYIFFMFCRSRPKSNPRFLRLTPSPLFLSLPSARYRYQLSRLLLRWFLVVLVALCVVVVIYGI